MSRTRIISQSKALYSSPTGLLPSNYGGTNPTDGSISGFLPTQLHRVDTVSFDVDLAGARQDVREFGQIARIATVRQSELTPTLSFGYYLGDGKNEHNLGLNIRGLDPSTNTPLSQIISGVLTEDENKKEKNIYMLTVQEGVDAFDSSTFNTSRDQHDVVGFGNATLTSYTANFAVGEIPRADVEVECGNIVFYTGNSSGRYNPAVNRDTAATVDTGRFILPVPSTGDTPVDVLKAGDVEVSFSNNGLAMGGAGFSGIHVQSLSFEVPLSRESIERLGNELPYAKPLEFPINVTCSVSAIVDNFKEGSLQTILTGCVINAGTDITVEVQDRCLENTDRLKFKLKNAVLDNQSFSLGLEDSETVDLTFSAQIGGATTSDAGLFMTGSFDGIGVAGKDNETPQWISGASVD